MGAGLCDRCAQLLEDFVALVRRASRELVRKIEECVKAIAQCCCLKRRTTASRTFYRPLVQEHERQAARELLQHLDTGSETPLLSSECLHALNTLAASENHELQRSASVYLLHLSQQLPTPLPSLFLEPYPPLLRSCDLEVQRMASLSLVNLLVERNVNKELVVEMGLLEPVMDMLESGDATIQCNSCACVAMLATSDSNREAIASADGVLRMLVLAKSYDPRVQQNAVGALLNLTRSERMLGVLCRDGGLPVLVLLLQSADSEVQFYSCSALSNIAAVREYHPRMLGIGDRFLLKSLLSLASSPVEKNSCEALRCLRNLSVNVRTQEELMALGCVSLLITMLRSPAAGVSESAITLLSALSQHPPNRDSLVEEDLLQTVGGLILHHRLNTTILSHGAVTIANLSVLPAGQQAVMDSACLSGLLEALSVTDTTEEALLCVTSCLHRLASLGENSELNVEG
ncbi:vacuolar protein 8-like [Megalops cyprinoides]|uniref:vacuolar protein 8-like n=1 Tax=Megalops cyprinoides TaxID=118141 RepID=UPI0018653770|nr:vacuolar protein 8-like [Megalops cyprinoides]